MKSLLAVDFTWKGYFETVFTGTNKDAAVTAAEKAIGIVETALWIVVGVVGLAAVIYAIFLGFQLARAADQSKRDEAKKHLITVVIAIVVTLVLVIFFLYLLPGILSAFSKVNL
ncbi:MAG: hypothetical protein J6K97_00660 [Clostridia bacterium]|nr:hypothetical protein [Clostridia bacterium]